MAVQGLARLQVRRGQDVLRVLHRQDQPAAHIAVSHLALGSRRASELANIASKTHAAATRGESSPSMLDSRRASLFFAGSTDLTLTLTLEPSPAPSPQPGGIISPLIPVRSLARGPNREEARWPP